MAMRKNKYKQVANTHRCPTCGGKITTVHCVACDAAAGITPRQRLEADAAANWLQLRSMTGQMSDQIENNRQRGDVA